APGLVLEAPRAVVVVLPGPPAELRRLWAEALRVEPVRRVLDRARPPELRLLRFFGASESAVAKALADAGGDGSGVEATICARDFEIHVDLVVEPGAEARADDLSARLAAPLEQYLFGRDGRPVEELVLGLCRERGLTLATAESCTGGLVAQRLTSVPGASDVFLGGVVAYSDDLKMRQLDVPAELLERHGAVSAEAAAAMAAGARARRTPDAAVDVLSEWQAGHMEGGRVVPREHLHLTLAFLGHRPVGELAAITGALREAASAARPIRLLPERYRETRSVGMLVLTDVGDAATSLAEDLFGRLEREGVYERERR